MRLKNRLLFSLSLSVKAWTAYLSQASELATFKAVLLLSAYPPTPTVKAALLFLAYPPTLTVKTTLLLSACAPTPNLSIRDALDQPF
jgi:hypothetical protein